MILARFLPKTLFWRLALISIGGLLFLRLALIPMENYSRNQVLFRNFVSIASRLLSVHMYTLGIAPEYTTRFNLSDVLNDGARFRVCASTSRPDVEDGATAFSQSLKPQLEQALAQARVDYSHLVARFQMIPQDSGNETDWQSGDSLLEQFRAHSYLRIEAAFQLKNGTWIHFFHSVNIPRKHHYLLEFMTVALEFSVVLGCMVLLLRCSLRPLHKLVDAVERFGKNRDVEPLDTDKGSVEVRQAAVVFNRMVQSLRQSFDERERILTSFSHDLRTPLTRIRLRLEQVEQEELREKLCADVDALKNTLNNTIAFLRSVRTEDEESVPLPVMPMLKELVAFRQGIGENCTLSGDTDVVLNANPLCIKSCIENVIDNALRYGICAKIHVHHEQTDRGRLLVIDVADCGPGIPPHRFKDVFEPYVRLETSRNQDTGGYGLGLSIARNNAQRNGGDIILSNLPEGGLRVRISFIV